jgi:hypothetical protein
MYFTNTIYSYVQDAMLKDKYFSELASIWIINLVDSVLYMI